MKKINLFLSLFSAVVVWAGDVPSAVAPRLTFDELRAACNNPERFHNQVAPRNLEIACSDVQFHWVQSDAQNIKLDVSHWITSSVISDKYTVAPVTKQLPAAQEAVACPQFKKVKDELSLNRAITCEEINAYKGDASDFCGDLLQDLRAANPGAVRTTDMNEIYSPCGNPPEDRGQRGQRGQREQRGQRDNIDRGQRDDNERGQRDDKYPGNN